MESHPKNLPLTIENGAYNELLRIRRALHLDANQGLRIGIKGGGCNGVSRFLAFDTREEKDEEFVSGDLKVFVSKGHMMHLVGFTIGFEESGEEKGFVFREGK